MKITKLGLLASAWLHVQGCLGLEALWTGKKKWYCTTVRFLLWNVSFISGIIPQQTATTARSSTKPLPLPCRMLIKKSHGKRSIKTMYQSLTVWVRYYWMWWVAFPIWLPAQQAASPTTNGADQTRPISYSNMSMMNGRAYPWQCFQRSLFGPIWWASQTLGDLSRTTPWSKLRSRWAGATSPRMRKPSCGRR